MVRFIIYGPPMGKGRPRFTKAGRTYTPTKTVSYENLVRTEYEMQSDGAYFDDDAQLWIHINAYFEIPRSTGKGKAELMRKQVVRPTKKPDGDNILKIVADALNGVAYRDDKSIVSAVVNKFYSDRPRVEVSIGEET